MTTSNEALEAIDARFVSLYTGVPEARWVLQNEDEDFTANTTDPWLRISVLNETRAQETLGKKGNRKYRSGDRLVVQVYTATNVGVQTGDNLAQEVLDLFEGESFSGLDFNNGLKRRAGADGKWYQHVAEVEFDYEQIK